MSGGFESDGNLVGQYGASYRYHANQLEWCPLYIPKFQIYAIIPNPVFSGFHHKDGKQFPLGR